MLPIPRSQRLSGNNWWIISAADLEKKLDQDQQNYTVSSASVLRDYLVKEDYKCSDEF